MVLDAINFKILVFDENDIITGDWKAEGWKPEGFVSLSFRRGEFVKVSKLESRRLRNLLSVEFSDRLRSMFFLSILGTPHKDSLILTYV